MMSPLDSRILDINSQSLGVSLDTLMDNAGKALADHILKAYRGKRILIVCGNGNNGGDGFSAAYHLRDENVTVAMLELGNVSTETSRKCLDRLKIRPKLFEDVDLKDHDVVVDCVLGTGVKGKIRQNVSDYLHRMENFTGHVVSADVPTGFGTGSALIPNATVTFHDIKEGMNESNSGKIVIADIGIPKEAYENVGPGDMLRYPIPKDDSHKGQNGRLLIIGGGPYIGAPAMSGLAAFRTGVDIVRIATPSRSFVPIASMDPLFIMHELPGDVLTTDHVKKLLEFTESVDAVLIGPGLGRDAKTQTSVSMFLEYCSRPMVIDADALAAVPSAKLRTTAILTPHHRELKELLGGDDDVAKFAFERNVTVVCKGRIDEITDGERTRRNITGTSAMTGGGTGDVLAGVIAGLLAKGMSAFDAACLGAYINGRAGEMAFSEYSYGMTATDLIGYVPKVLLENLR